MKNCQMVKSANMLMCSSIWTHKTINFPFVPNGEVMVLGVPIFNMKGKILGYFHSFDKCFTGPIKTIQEKRNKGDAY